jgi:hypothetical protein
MKHCTSYYYFCPGQYIALVIIVVSLTFAAYLFGAPPQFATLLSFLKFQTEKYQKKAKPFSKNNCGKSPLKNNCKRVRRL